MTKKILTLKNPPKIEDLQKTAFEKQQQCLEFLCNTFPECFSKRSPSPLKTNILHEIADQLGDDMPFSKTTLRQTLQVYCHNFKYLSKTLESNHRIGLDGEKVDDITQTHREYTQEQLERLKKKKFAKKLALLRF